MKRFLIGFACGVCAMNVVAFAIGKYVQISETQIRRKAVGL